MGIFVILLTGPAIVGGGLDKLEFHSARFQVGHATDSARTSNLELLLGPQTANQLARQSGALLNFCDREERRSADTTIEAYTQCDQPRKNSDIALESAKHEKEKNDPRNKQCEQEGVYGFQAGFA